MAATPFVQLSLADPPRLAWLSNGRFGPASHDTYCLPDHWALHLYHYHGRWQLDDGPWLELRPGTLGLTPPGATARYQWLHEDSFHCGAHLQLGPGSELEVPLLLDLEDAYRRCHDTMQAAIEVYPLTPHRAEAMLWALLWELLPEAGAPPESVGHRAVSQAIGYIERHLAEPLQVHDIADRVALSHNHLTRLFKAETGDTVIGYIRRRRAERVERLLRETSLPAKAVAIEVGVPDLQQFNKLTRELLGRSPRNLRRGGAQS